LSKFSIEKTAITYMKSCIKRFRTNTKYAAVYMVTK